ncbi:MAG: hypothetical protein U0228_26720 [Myxococcaceae bacterium]
MPSPLSVRAATATGNIAGELVNRFPYVMTGSLFPLIGALVGGWRGLLIGFVVGAVIVGPAYLRARAMARRHEAERRAFQAEAERSLAAASEPSAARSPRGEA